ncbi:MAG: hypothetical protein CMB47_03355 [Euryarchaeota archaeon]|nr:hypothetical protein [Euryarchaeota archaeon]|tara:strand:+ start:3663 stop:4526 length:864 start_codon:yes stop_codon:yes gene_type:complete
MNKISWSQVQTYVQCPYKWKLNYIDKNRKFTDSIYTVYGKAVHEVIQHYLTVMYDKSIKEADEIDMPNMLVDKVKYFYSEGVKNADGEHFSKQSELTEFCVQGAKALDWFKRHRGEYFTKKNWELLGIEVPIEDKYKSVGVLGYIDVLMRNTKTGKIKIIDLKTSTMGWKKEKTDPMKRGQLLFYKKFIADKYDVDISMVDVEFIIIKRIVWDKGDWPVKWIQRFEPPSANVSINRVFKQVDLFINEGFNKDGSYNTEATYEKLGVNTKCKWCEFAKSPEICDKGKK